MASVLIKGFQFVFRYLGPVFPNASSRLVRKLWFTNLRLKKSHIEQKVADTATAKTLNIHGIPIRLWIWGDSGPPILFIHGWSGRGTQITSFVKPLLDQGFRVISFDAPAHGESGGKKTNIFNIVDTFSEILNQLDPLYGVITHSMGAMILAQLIKDKISPKKIVLICPPTTLEVMINNFQHQLQIPEKVKEKFRQLLIQDFGEEAAEQISLLNKTHQFNCPVLIVHDENDPEIPWEDSEKLAQQIAQAEFFKTQGLGHIRVLYDRTVISKVSDFLRS
jgi:pimeloyl-ACP methyl ester carboxylesterase